MTLRNSPQRCLEQLKASPGSWRMLPAGLLRTQRGTSLFFLPPGPGDCLRAPWFAQRRGAPHSPPWRWFWGFIPPEAGCNLHSSRMKYGCNDPGMAGFLGGFFNPPRSDFQGDFPAQGQALGGSRVSRCRAQCGRYNLHQISRLHQAASLFTGHQPGTRTAHAVSSVDSA